MLGTVLQHTRQTRITANLVGMMIFVQVILGGSATVLGFPIIYHLIWGTLTLIVLIAATVLARRDFGSSSNLFKVAVAAIADFVVQIVLGLFSVGLFSFGSSVVLVVHLTNAILLTVIVTYLISFADTADKAASAHTQTKVPTSGNMPA